jgi:hypothetical protein
MHCCSARIWASAALCTAVGLHFLFVQLSFVAGLGYVCVTTVAQCVAPCWGLLCVYVKVPAFLYGFLSMPVCGESRSQFCDACMLLLVVIGTGRFGPHCLKAVRQCVRSAAVRSAPRAVLGW